MDLASTDKLYFSLSSSLSSWRFRLSRRVTRHTALVDDMDTANSAADDGSSGEIFEAAMSRIRGVTALISRTYGELGLTKRDAMTIRSKGDVGMNSLYPKLTVVPFYRDLVAEYWATIDDSDRCMPHA